MITFINKSIKNSTIDINNNVFIFSVFIALKIWHDTNTTHVDKLYIVTSLFGLIPINR